MSLLRKLLTALAALTLLTGFVACGDDDDDDDAVSVQDSGDEADADAVDDDMADDEAADDDGVSGPTAAFCADWDETSSGEDTPVDDVQTSHDLAVSAQEEVPSQEVADALQLLVDFSQYVLDNDDGDGVITTAELQAAAEQFPTFEDAAGVVNEFCGSDG